MVIVSFLIPLLTAFNFFFILSLLNNLLYLFIWLFGVEKVERLISYFSVLKRLSSL